MSTAADTTTLAKMAQKLRRISIEMTTESASGHPTTCMSAAEIVSTLFFHEMRFDPSNPGAKNVDVFVLSKGHAAPIQWAALKEAGAIDEDPMTLRKFDSTLEGHPTPRNPWVRVATGSLGQGLSAASGMAKARKIEKTQGRVFCLLGDGETAEGSVWEAAAFAAHEGLDNLCAIVDVNRLGQSGPTMYEHDVELFARRFAAFGWEAVPVDGHSVDELVAAFAKARGTNGRPTAIIARTLKGKGVSFVENKDGFHGKPIPKDKLQDAVAELGDTDVTIKVPARPYEGNEGAGLPTFEITTDYKPEDKIATRVAYGVALAKLGEQHAGVVVTDGDTKNSTFAETFKTKFPDRFVEAFIAEQNMVGVTLGMSKEGLVPFASSFACFLSRAYDFIRMAGYSKPERMILCGSHSGVSIGEDGPSQMALEDLAMMRPVFGCAVLYPSDGVSAEKLTAAAANNTGITYIRTTRPKTAILYDNNESFPIGGSKVLRSSDNDKFTVIAAGITLHHALSAYESLKKEGVNIRVIDLYSVKPIDEETIRKAAKETGGLITVEDHSVHGGIGEAVASVATPRKMLGVREIPRSGRPDELMAWAGIDADSIVKTIKSL